MENVNKAERIVEFFFFFTFFLKFFFLNLSFCSFIFFWYRSQVFLGRKIKRRKEVKVGVRKGNQKLIIITIIIIQYHYHRERSGRKVPGGWTAAKESVLLQWEEKEAIKCNNGDATKATASLRRKLLLGEVGHPHLYFKCEGILGHGIQGSSWVSRGTRFPLLILRLPAFSSLAWQQRPGCWRWQ